MVTFFALTSEDGVAKVRSIMEEEFLRIRQDLVSEKELADAKVYLVSRMARDLQTLDAQTITRAVDELLGLGYGNVDEYSAKISAVSSDDVRKAALKHLDVVHAALVVVKPSLKKQGE